MHKKLVLFDIDGTLLTSGGAGERALRNGFHERFGIEDDLAKVEIAGRTDSGIARAMLGAHGLADSSENCAAFYEAYLGQLALELPRARGSLLPGILSLLEELKSRAHIVLALLTGNLARGAELKLRPHGIWDYFEFGAFADDHHDRNELGPFVRARARAKHGIEFAPERIFVLGDTPHDIACAHAIGAQAIGVATGKFSTAELAAARADFVFADFSETEAVLAIVG